MDKSVKLFMLILTLFSLHGVATGTWAECILSISPISASVAPGAEVLICVELTGDSCVPPDYTWEISASNCTGDFTILGDCVSFTSSFPCSETIKVTDTANGNISAEATVHICGEISVSISTTTTDLSNNETQTFTAKTTCDGTEVAANYTWELDGVSVGMGDSYTFPCNEANDGSHTLKATDTSNGVSDTETINCSMCEIIVVPDQFPCSRWVPLPAIVTIKCLGTGCDFSFNCRIDISCDSESKLPPIIPAGKLVFPNTQTIHQLVLIMPSILTGIWGNDCETCTVRAIGCGCDSPIPFVDICPRPFPLDVQR